jgi:hypothetical protein
MASFGIIKSSALPNIYPVSNFQDIRYFENRVERIGYHEEIFKTDKKYKAIGVDSFYRERVVQVIAYKKYRVIFYVKENTNIELLKYADVISVTLQDGVTVHQCMVIELNVDNLQPSGLRKVEMIYADINPVNYPEYIQPVSNFLKSENVYSILGFSAIELKLYSNAGVTIDSEWTTVSTAVVGGAREYKIYTKLGREIFNTTPAALTDEQQGLTYASRITSKRGARYRFYVSEQQAYLLQKYISLFVQPNASIFINDAMYGDTLNNENTEMIIPTIEPVESAIDLWSIDLDFYYENNIFNPYE